MTLHTLASIALLGVGNVLAALIILASLRGKLAPKWSQRWGNVIVVLSLLALLIKLDAPATSVWLVILDVWSFCLAIVGTLWGALGDVVCTAIRSKIGWNDALRDAVNE